MLLKPLSLVSPASYQAPVLKATTRNRKDITDSASAAVRTLAPASAILDFQTLGMLSASSGMTNIGVMWGK